MSAPTCEQCKHGTVTNHSSGNKCAHVNNVKGYHPYALRHDETLCGLAATWFEARPARSTIYRAAEAVKER